MAGYKAFLSDISKLQSERLFLDPQESHHLCRVLRASKDSVVEVFDGKGTIYKTKLLEANPRNAELEIIQKDRLAIVQSKRFMIIKKNIL